MEFQFQAMEVNTTTPLFSITFNSEPKHQENEDDHDLDPEYSTIEIMQNCLNVQIMDLLMNECCNGMLYVSCTQDLHLLV